MSPFKNLTLILDHICVSTTGKIEGYAEFDSKTFKIAGGENTFCSTSNQCGTNLYLSCGSGRGPYFIVQIALDKLKVGKNNYMQTTYKSSQMIMFDNQMMGIDCFKIIFPFNTTGFVVKCDLLSNKYCLLFAELTNNPSKPGKDCIVTETPQKFPQWLCPLSVRAKLEFVSVENYDLMIHTKSGGQMVKDPVPICHLMNDCYSCRLMASKSNLKCAWSYGLCINAIIKDYQNMKDCVTILRTEFFPKIGAFEVFISGMRLENPSISVSLKARTKTFPSHKQANDHLIFIVKGDTQTISLIQQKSDDLYLLIESQIINGSQVTVQINQDRSRGSEFLAFSILAFIIAILIIIILQRRHRKRLEESKIRAAKVLLEKTISGVPQSLRTEGLRTEASPTETLKRPSSKVSEIDSKSPASLTGLKVRMSAKKSVLDNVKSVPTGPISKTEGPRKGSKMESEESGTDKDKFVPTPPPRRKRTSPLRQKSQLDDQVDDRVKAVRSSPIADAGGSRKSKIDDEKPKKSQIDDEKFTDDGAKAIRSRPPSEIRSEVQRPSGEGKRSTLDRVGTVLTAPISKFLSREKKDGES